MNKLLFWAIVIGVGLLLWKMFSAKARGDGRDGRSGDGPGASAGGKRPGKRASAELMLECEHCGVHVPASEAVQLEGHAFCSKAHRDAFHKGR